MLNPVAVCVGDDAVLFIVSVHGPMARDAEVVKVLGAGVTVTVFIVGDPHDLPSSTP